MYYKITIYFLINVDFKKRETKKSQSFNWDFYISKSDYLIISIFNAASWFTESKKPCSLIQSSLNTLLMYLEP
mgnify:CR=1 FL=1